MSQETNRGEDERALAAEIGRLLAELEDGVLAASQKLLLISVLSLAAAICASAVALYAVWKLKSPELLLAAEDGRIASLRDLGLELVRKKLDPPTDEDKIKFARRFLQLFEAGDYRYAQRDIKDALNLMTSDIAEIWLSEISRANLIGRMREGRIIAKLEIKDIQVDGRDPWLVFAYASKEIRSLVAGRGAATAQDLKYTLRLHYDESDRAEPLRVSEFKAEVLK